MSSGPKEEIKKEEPIKAPVDTTEYLIERSAWGTSTSAYTSDNFRFKSFDVWLTCFITVLEKVIKKTESVYFAEQLKFLKDIQALIRKRNYLTLEEIRVIEQNHFAVLIENKVFLQYGGGITWK